MPDSCGARHDLRAFYDNYYTSATQWRQVSAKSKAANIVRLVGENRHDMILDIGSGDGAVLSELAALGFGDSVYSLEISRSALVVLSGRKIANLVQLAQFDGYSLPFADSSFDLVILSHVIEHVEHPRRLLCEAARVGGLVFAEVPLEDNIRLTDKPTSLQSGHINYYSAKTFSLLLASCGLRVQAELISNPSADAYQFRSGRIKGALSHAVKEGLLRLCPRLATLLFTYHYATLSCRSADTPQQVNSDH